jgi:hypothetical protein
MVAVGSITSAIAFMKPRYGQLSATIANEISQRQPAWSRLYRRGLYKR